jgi:hypothetical protein
MRASAPQNNNDARTFRKCSRQGNRNYVWDAPIAAKRNTAAVIRRRLYFCLRLNYENFDLGRHKPRRRRFQDNRVVGKDRKIIAEVAPNVTRYVDRNAPSNACYIITAFNAAGESSPSNSVCPSASPPTALSRAGK